jgi:hypothetical protein
MASTKMAHKEQSGALRQPRFPYPSRPLSEQLLRHLANFARRPLPDKGFQLFQMHQRDPASSPHPESGTLTAGPKHRRFLPSAEASFQTAACANAWI